MLSEYLPGTSKAYSNCENSGDIISAHNSWVSQPSRPLPTALPEGAFKASHTEDDGESYSDSDDGLPPLERNTNHLNMDQESDEDEESCSDLDGSLPPPSSLNDHIKHATP